MRYYQLYSTSKPFFILYDFDSSTNTVLTANGVIVYTTRTILGPNDIEITEEEFNFIKENAEMLLC